MKKPLAVSTIGGLLKLALLAAAVAATVPSQASAQYFGRNKVQFDDFDFEVLDSDHFNWYYYPSETEAVYDAVRMGERWYERFARTFQHEFESSKPVILYADHPDFQQTNTLSGFIGEGTGGVTESLKNRVIMPLTGSYWDTDHVLGHELVHAFQYNIAQSRRGGGLQGLGRLPLWLVEGMAEYFSVGRDDPLTAMWLRDAIRRDELPTIRQMTRDVRFFPYRFGQALWAYIGGTYGDDAVVQVYRRSLRVGFEGAIEGVLGMSTDTLSVRWKEQVAEAYLPLMEGRDAPEASGRVLFAPSQGTGATNIAPTLSPDGRYVAFLTQKELFSIDLYMADVQTGEIIRQLSSANSDPHIEALRYIDSSGTWSPDSEQFAYVAFADGDNQLVVVNSDNGRVDRRIAVEGIGAMANPSWSPDGRYIAFSGQVGGMSDLYLYDLETEETTRLTNDKFADLQPDWSPDGRTIAFTTDRGPTTDFEQLTYSKFQLGLIDVATNEVRVLPVFGNVKHINPQFSADGRSLFFVSDQDGFSDVYELNLASGGVERHTTLATAVSGITYLSPAMSLADDGTLAYSVFDDLEFHIYTIDVDEPGAPVAIVENPELQPGRKLPPTNPDRFSRVETYLADAQTGLVESGTWVPSDADDYSSSLSLDYVGQPTIGVGTDSYGNYIGGATSAYFSDMLGDKILGVALQAQGTFKDIGGSAFYADLGDRVNWMASAGRIPYLLGGFVYGQDDLGDYFGLQRLRIYISSANGQIQYPFSSTDRIEFGLGVNRYSYDFEIDKYYTDEFGYTFYFDREQLEEPDPLNLFQGSIALVHDNSYFGFVSPIQGSRYRLEVEHSVGTVDFTTVVGDFRRYFQPFRNLTIGFRAMHIGRYDLQEDEHTQDGFGILNPLFLGFETFVRGYAWESFNRSECDINATTTNTCPTLNRLYGHKLGVANLEMRIPLLGVEQYGLINFGFVPTELVFFADIGAAAGNPFTNDRLEVEWTRSTSARVPVASTGVSARFNVLGMLILEAYYAYPFQRPLKGWHWGFQLAPGW